MRLTIAHFETFIRYSCFHVHIFWAPWRQCVHLVLLNRSVTSLLAKATSPLFSEILNFGPIASFRVTKFFDFGVKKKRKASEQDPNAFIVCLPLPSLVS